MNKIWTLLISLLLVGSCGNDNVTTDLGNDPEPPEWLIPSDQVFDGGPGKDGIPSIDNPRFTLASEVNFLDEDETVLVIKRGDQLKVYPHSILNWHEIVNDELGDLKYALTYCPLTGTGIGWNRIINGSETTFGVSGLLYNTNLMPYDRLTNSTWTQQGLRCVNGELIGTESENITFLETNFSTISTSFPEAEVLNTSTGFGRDYNRYPYGDYLTNTAILFPISVEDGRLHPKERTLAVYIGNEPTAFTFNESGLGLTIHTEILENQKTHVITSADDNIITAFISEDEIDLSPVQNALPIIAEDQNGNRYDLFGKVVENTNGASDLIQPIQFVGFWFSWASFHEELDLVELK